MPNKDEQDMTSEEPSAKSPDKLVLLPFPIEPTHQNPCKCKMNDEVRILRAEDRTIDEDGETVLKTQDFGVPITAIRKVNKRSPPYSSSFRAS
jgi:hypothetical protein